MIQINPYLTFDCNCREAMTFYRESLGGELTFQTIAETPIADQCPGWNAGSNYALHACEGLERL